MYEALRTLVEAANWKHTRTELENMRREGGDGMKVRDLAAPVGALLRARRLLETLDSPVPPTTTCTRVVSAAEVFFQANQIGLWKRTPAELRKQDEFIVLCEEIDRIRNES
jgi:hypothetical protein